MTTGQVALFGSEDDSAPESKKPQDLHKFWAKEKTAAQKRVRKFTKQGNAVVDRFRDERGNQSDLGEGGGTGSATKINLFHTNISTLQAMLFGNTPAIDVSREHQDPDDDVARVAALMYQRILEADIQTINDDYATTLKAALQDRLLPGIGVSRVHYDMTTKKVQQLDPVTMEAVEVEEVDTETCTCDYVNWQDFLWGWGRTWTEIPWVGFRSYLTKKEAKTRFGSTKAAKLEYKNQLPTGSDKNESDSDKEQENNVQKAEVWEFWQKSDRKVYWYAEGLDLILDAVPDPYGLAGFWPCPMPLTANMTTTLFMPRADFVINQDLYNEIDVLYSRINIITRAIKVVGVYDKNAQASVGRMLKEGSENDLIPVDNWAMFAEKGGLAGVIDWFPVEAVVGVLTTLRSLLGEQIELLYQVTGMSDILRGANTDQYTSDGTNQLKAKFGSIRVQALQDEFARFASDLDNLKVEIINKHFEEKTIVKQSNAQFLPSVDQDKIGPALQLMKSPDLQWRVSIRPESIAMVDYAQLKQERTEFLTAMATYIQSATGAVQSMPGSLPVLMEMLKWGMSGFKGSNYLEGMMDAAIEAAKKAEEEKKNAPQEDPAAKEAQMAQQAAQMAHQNEMQKIQHKGQTDMAVQQAKNASAMEAEALSHRNKMQQEMLEAKNEIAKLREDFMADVKIIEASLASSLKQEQAQSTYAIEEESVKHQFEMEEMGADHATNMIEKIEDNANAEMEAGRKNREDGTDR